MRTPAARNSTLRIAFGPVELHPGQDTDLRELLNAVLVAVLVFFEANAVDGHILQEVEVLVLFSELFAFLIVSGCARLEYFG